MVGSELGVLREAWGFGSSGTGAMAAPMQLQLFPTLGRGQMLAAIAKLAAAPNTANDETCKSDTKRRR